MKKRTLIPILLLLTGLLAAGCGRKPPVQTSGGETVAPTAPQTEATLDPAERLEEIFGRILGSRDNLRLRLRVTTESGGIGTEESAEYDVDGGKIRILTERPSAGEERSEESYYEIADSAAYLYFQQEGVWYRMAQESDAQGSGGDGEEGRPIPNLADPAFTDFLLNADCYGPYDEGNGRYPIPDFSGLTGLSDGERQSMQGWMIPQGDGCTIRLEGVFDGSRTAVDLSFSDFGKITVNLPDAEDYVPIRHPESALTPDEIGTLLTDSESFTLRRTLQSDGGEPYIDEVITRQGEDWSIVRSGGDGEVTWVLEKTEKGRKLSVGRAVLDEEGNFVRTEWTSSTLAEEESRVYLPDLTDLIELLSTERFGEYDPDGGTYAMKAGAFAEMTGFGRVSNATVTVTLDDTDESFYTVTVPVAVGEAACTLEYTLSGIGQSQIRYPEG